MTFTKELADFICAELESGKSLRAVCEAQGMPSPSTVLRWTKDETKEGFAEQYAQARLRQYEMLADEILEISDRSESDSYVDKDGNTRTNTEVVARSRLMVDSRKWLLSKMLPKVYGEKLDLSVKNEGGVKELSDAELVRIATRGGERIAGEAGGEEISSRIH